jgi:hypothetical protein
VACPPWALRNTTTTHTGPTLPTGLPCGFSVCGTAMRLSPPYRASIHTSAAVMACEV